MSKRSEEFAENGYAIVPGVLSDSECELAIAALSKRTECAAGSRRLLNESWCRDLTHKLAEAIDDLKLPAPVVAVQCTLFDKNDNSNWSVTPHQDLSIPVAERVNGVECSGWSQKEGVLFTQPRVSVLDRMVAARLQLDRDDEHAGQLCVIPGTHKAGRLRAHDLLELSRCEAKHICRVPRGGVLILHPLLVHSSSKIRDGLRRRVLHFLFGPNELPFGLRWPQLA